MKALITDDDPLILNLLRRQLKAMEFEVTTVGSGAEAIEIFERETYPVVLLDWVLPDLEGPELASQIRGLEGGRDAVIMMITSKAETHDLEKAVDAGCDDFLTKPIVFSLLRTRLLIARRTAEQRIRNRNLEIEMDQFFNSSLDMLSIMSYDGFFKRLNPAWETVLGHSLDELMSKPFLHYVHPNDYERTLHESASLITGQDSIKFENRYQSKDGDYRWLRWTTTINSEQQLYYAVASDVTEEKAVLEKLHRSEERFRQISENIDGVFWISDPQLNELLYVSPLCEWILGIDPATLLGDPQLWWEHIESKDSDELQRALKDQPETGHDLQYEFKRPDGETRWIHSRAFPIVDDEGSVYRLAGIAEDVTEARMLEAELVHSRKLESIGQLAAGIAHEINSPTQYVGDNIRFLQDAFDSLMSIMDKVRPVAEQEVEVEAKVAEELSELMEEEDVEFLSEEVPTAIKQALDGVSRVSEIVSAMREFSHPGSADKVPTDINRAITNTITVARNEWKYVSEVETDFDEELPPVPCLPGEFNQVVLNIIVNAAHAIGEKGPQPPNPRGTITVATRLVGETAEIRITDTGGGIPEDIRARIFDPFFTTKEVGKGTGQGLSIAHSVIADKHGGSITVESEEGVGSTFIIALPLVTADQPVEVS